jgi:hypothetical protein
MEISLASLCRWGASLALAVGVPAIAENITLVPDHEPGDAYVLTLSARTETDAASGGSVNKRFREMMRVDYQATVLVLEVDSEGGPIRERHDDVRMVVRSTKGSGPVFEGDTSFEVHRGEDGELSVLSDGFRVPPKKGRAITRVLETRFEHSLEPSVLDPGGPVAVGDTWELDRTLARRMLWQRGVRVVEFAEPATATLVQRAGEDGKLGLEIDYRIPISWLRVEGLFEGAMAGQTRGVLAGTVRLAASPEGMPISRKSQLTLNVEGAATTSGRVGGSRPYPWSVSASKVVEQTAVKVGEAPAPRWPHQSSR